MKFKKILIAALFLIFILMMGVASASDENMTSDELTVCEDSVIESISDVEVEFFEDDEEIVFEEDNEEPLMQPQNGEIVGEKENVTIDFQIDDVYVGEGIYEFFWADVPGEYQFFIDGKMYDDRDISIGDYVTVSNENLSQMSLGTHDWEFKFLGNENFNPTSVNGTFNYIFMSIEFPEVVHCRESEFFISVPDHNPGYITFYINGEEISKTECDEYYRRSDISIPALTSFTNYTYTIVHSLHPEYVYNGTFENTFIGAYIDDEVSTSEPAELLITLPEDISGNVEIYLNNELVKKVAAEELLEIEIDGFNFGNNTVTVKYLGNNKYPARTYSQLIYVVPKIKVDSYNPAYTDPLKISLLLPGDTNGTLIAYIDGEMVAKSNFTNGKSIIEISNLSLGEHGLTVIYNGTDYEVDEEWGNIINVIPKITLPGGNNYYVSLQLPSDATGDMVVSIDGNEVRAKLKNGMAKIDVSKINFGYAKMDIRYEGNYPKFEESYYFASLTPKIKVSHESMIVGLFAQPIEFRFPEKVTGTCYVYGCNDRLDYHKFCNFYGFVPDPFGYKNFVQVSDFACIRLDTTFASYKSGSGMFEAGFYDETSCMFSIAFMKLGTFTLNIHFSFDGDKYGGVDYNLTIKAIRGNIVLSSNSIVFGEPYNVKIVDDAGKPIADKRILTDEGKVIETREKGYPLVLGGYDLKKPGTYKLKFFTICATKKVTLKVKHRLSLKTVKVKKSAKKLVLTATLAKKNGKYLKSKKITFKFNGKKYTAKTNSKGVAKITIGKKVLKKLKVGKKVKYQASYYESNGYDPLKIADTVKKTVKVRR